MTAPPAAERALLAAVAAVALVAVVALDPVERARDFRSEPAVLAADTDDLVRSHLVSGSGNGRWQLWTAAVEQFRARPLLGGGAASFQFWWQQHREISAFARDAHSLYLEMLAELGLVGFLLVAGFVATGLAAGTMRAARTRGDERVTVASLTAVAAAFALAAAIDWMWEVTVVAVVALAAFALVTGRATAPAAPPRSVAPLPLRIGIVALGLAVVVAQALPMLAGLELEASYEAARRGEADRAVAHAQAARRLEPWASSPYLQLALLAEEAGRLPAARSWIGEAIDRDRSNWQLWLAATRIETKAGDIREARRSLARARELNPLWRAQRGERR